MKLKEIVSDYVDWKRLALDWDKMWAFVNTVMK
jgi:hypothetical protein